MREIPFLVNNPQVLKKLQESLYDKCPEDFAIQIEQIPACYASRHRWKKDPKCNAVSKLILQLGQSDFYFKVRTDMIETMNFLSKINDTDENSCSFEFFRSIPSKYLAAGFLGFLLLDSVDVRTKQRFVYNKILFI